MKHQTWMALALAAAIAVPVAAQQTTTDQNSQPATSQTQQNETSAQTSQNATGQSSADQNLSPRQPLQQETHEGFWGHLNPFARKKYVQRQMGPIRERVNELDELTANNTKMIKDVDSRAQEGIRLADAKASQADQHAIDAGNRAQAANQTAQQASARLGTVEQVVTNIDQYKPVNETDIMFRPGQTVLSKKAKDALDQMAENVKGQKGYVVEVQGFSSGHGQSAIQNSQHMADSVVRYLVLNHDIPVYRIYVLGMGNAPRPATAQGEKPRRTTGGRVEISLLKNDVEQLSAQANAPVSGALGTENQGGMTGTSTAVQANQTMQPVTSNPAEPPTSQQQPPQR
jgi:outer membrane protein OmpA-like peptidoglycan-associated protein